MLNYGIQLVIKRNSISSSYLECWKSLAPRAHAVLYVIPAETKQEKDLDAWSFKII